MTSTPELLESIKSKRTCRYCGEKKIQTNDSEKVENFVFYHCFQCGGDFIENEEEREFRDEDKKDDTPWGAGVSVLVAMLITILLINVVRDNPNIGGQDQTVIESLNDR